ncbi:MAG TPA: hypothetical protein VNG32_04580, partial [Candidatus Dormibacteraeota bacterium]|nr:hypothetical protein [Candidatus Dormibacteraeota bacterium]
NIVQNRSFDFVVGFSMMQHTYSQSLYDDWFRPMGIDIGYQDIYHKSDANLNRGTKSNAELVLCRRLSDRATQVDIHVPKRDRSMANNILGKLGVGTQFNDDGELDSNTGTFLGFHPDGEGELFLPAFLPTGIAVDFSPLVTSNNERQDFVDEIRNRYEQTIKS